MRYLPGGIQREVGTVCASGLTTDIPPRIRILASQQLCIPLCYGRIFNVGIYLTWVSTTYLGSVYSHQYSSNSKVLGLDGEALAEHSRQWGPSARICVDLQRDPLMFPSLVSKPRTAAAAFVDNFGRIDELEVMTFSDILFAIRPKGPNMPHRLNGIVAVATDYLNQVLTEATAAANPHQRVKFYKMMTIRPGFESPALYMLRSFFYAWFFNCQKSPKLRCSAAPGIRPRYLDSRSFGLAIMYIESRNFRL